MPLENILMKLRDIYTYIKNIKFDSVSNVLINREDSLASFRGDLQITEDVFYQVPESQEVIVKDSVYVEGELYVEGILEVV